MQMHTLLNPTLKNLGYDASAFVNYPHMQRMIVHSLRIPAKQARADGFTRFELLVVVIAMAMLAVVVLPVFAQGKPRGQQALCLNNLRLIGQAILVFDIEHGQTDPWRIPDSETSAPPLKNNAWYHFYLLSNELQTPKILACPSDNTKRATDFSFSPDGGLLHQTYQNRAISYFLGLDSFFTSPDSILSGDRNIQLARFGGGCSSGINPVGEIFSFGQSPTAWIKGIHGTSGNILFHDGRVEELSTTGLNRAFSFSFRNYSDDNGSSHLLLPSPFFP
jgi:prepilin-type processing-associated H-X9-DG protein